MATVVTPAQLAGLYKQVYPNGVVDLIPEASLLTNFIKFSEEDKLGDYYHQPVILTHESGVTYHTATGGAFKLISPTAMVMQDAQLQGYQIVLRSQFSYDMASKSSTSKAAFQKGLGLVLENMTESITKRVEVAMLYGQSGLGITSSSSNVDSTHTTITFTAASWAPGIWLGEEGAQVVFYSSTTLKGINAGTGIHTIQSVNVVNRTITVTGNGASDITQLDTDIAAGALTIYFLGTTGYTSSTSTNPATTYSATEMAGVDKIVTNTGTLFNVPGGTYNLWCGNTYSASSAAFSLPKLLGGVTTAVNRGLNEKTTVLCSVNSWTNLASDQAALRRVDGSYKETMENGFRTLKFYHMNGEIEVIGHNLVKQGEAFILPFKRWKRIGSSEITTKTPGRSDDIFTQLADNAGYEMRLYTDQAVFCEQPAKCVKVTSIVNT